MGGGETVRQKSSFGLVGVLNRSLVDRQIGKMQKSKQPKAKPVCRRGQGEGFSFELTSSAAAAGKFVMRNIHLAQLFRFSSCAPPRRRRRRRRPLCDLYLQSEIFRAPSATATSSVPSFTFRLKWEFRVRV